MRRHKFQQGILYGDFEDALENRYHHNEKMEIFIQENNLEVTITKLSCEAPDNMYKIEAHSPNKNLKSFTGSIDEILQYAWGYVEETN